MFIRPVVTRIVTRRCSRDIEIGFPVCLSVCHILCLPVTMFICLTACLTVNMSLCLFFRLSLLFSIPPSLYLVTLADT